MQQSLPEVGESLVLTVPVDSFEVYRSWLSGVCETLPVERIRLLDEPTAAALGYGMTAAETLLVVDFGGGTLDLSLVQLTNTETARQNTSWFSDRSGGGESGRKFYTNTPIS